MTSSPVVRPVISLRLVRAHVWRASLIWIVAHVFLALATGELMALSTKAVVIVALIASAVAVIDARRRREVGFLGNLGVPRTLPGILSAVTVFALEIILATALAV